MVEWLVPLSHHFRALCRAGAVDRLRELLAADPTRVNREDRPGEIAIFCLPNRDEDKALEVAELLLSYGANPGLRNAQGQTPAQVARGLGFEEVAAVLDEAAN